MTGLFPTFLDENANRAFPFVENTISSSVPDSCFLDFRGWSRLGINTLPNFYMIYDQTSGHPVPTGYESFVQPGMVHLFFELIAGNTLISRTVCFYVPAANSTWPYLSKSTLLASSGAKSLEVKIVVDSPILSVLIPENNGSATVGPMFVEPAQLMNVGGIVIDSLSVIHSQVGNPERFITGDVVFLPGINNEVTQSGSGVVLTTQQGYGLGQQVYYGTDNGVCDGNVSLINGASPDNNDVFSIVAGPGVIIKDSPSTNSIMISLDPANNSAQCP